MQYVWPLLLIAFLAETILYVAAPAVYSLAARFPLGPSRRLVLDPRAAEALRSAPRQGAMGYRESAAGAVDLGRLELPPRLEVDELVLHFRLARGFAIARRPYTFGRRAYGLVRVDVLLANGAVELRPRFVMMGWPTLVGLAPFGAAAVFATMQPSDWPRSFVIGALFLGINAVLALLMGRPQLERGVDEIERQIRAALVSAEHEA